MDSGVYKTNMNSYSMPQYLEHEGERNGLSQDEGKGLESLPLRYFIAMRMYQIIFLKIDIKACM